MILITGANGHLGNTIIRLLQKENCQIRGLILPNETPASQFHNTTYFYGDVCKKETLLPRFRRKDAFAAAKALVMKNDRRRNQQITDRERITVVVEAERASPDTDRKG